MSSITVTVRERVSVPVAGKRGKPEVAVQCAPQSSRADSQPEIALQCVPQSYRADAQPEIALQCVPQSYRADAQPEIALQCQNRSYWPADLAGAATVQSEV